jgi:hypothetical protein
MPRPATGNPNRPNVTFLKSGGALHPAGVQPYLGSSPIWEKLMSTHGGSR